MNRCPPRSSYGSGRVAGPPAVVKRFTRDRAIRTFAGMSSPRHRRLAVRAPLDPVLHHVAPLGLAAATGAPTLVVDLDPSAPGYPGRTLADLAADGPRLADLRPDRDGVAVIGHGGLGDDDIAELVPRLLASWPFAVIRVPGFGATDAAPVIPVHPLLPAPLDPPSDRPAAYQAHLRWSKQPGPGLLLPPPGRSATVRMLGGTIEPRSRWVRAWAPAWELPWP